MKNLAYLFENNRIWSETIRQSDPAFFERLAEQQAPEYLWIGCSDSRVPANQIIGLPPGEVFVHRNIANVVVHTDFNCLSVLQFAVEVLGVRHVIVCGHHGCGGVEAALKQSQLGLVDNWLRHVRDVYRAHEEELLAIGDVLARHDRLCELNALAQMRNVCGTTIVRSAWKRGRELSIHAFIYSLRDGLLREIASCVTSVEEADALGTS